MTATTQFAPAPETAVSDEQLLARFRPVFDRIREGAADRENARRLPFEEVEWLRAAGFGAVRVPAEWGGSGASTRQFFRLLIELAEADSNLAQLLRGHFAFLEVRLAHPDPAYREHWARAAVDGVLVGNAQSELGNATFEEASTVLTEQEVDGATRLVLNGTKYYSTGTLFADWINVTAAHGDERVTVAVPTTAPGVTRIDDWTGFGQRLTGSGTTEFRDVVVDEEHVTRYSRDAPRPTAISGFYQLVLLATLAGIARAAARDAVAFVSGRSRRVGLENPVEPRHSPAVQQVIGTVSGLALATESTVLAAADPLEDAFAAQRDGVTDLATFDDANVTVFRAQGVVIDLTLQATTALFEVGGASATSEKLRLDRHWRNARTVASHNPAIFRAQAVGHYLLHGSLPARPTPEHRSATGKDADA
ncbi:Acyl-CoA dehydrogenase type 2 domain protein [Beutenbergia cavernae DSM 12333]|uniref:Acyl-CoA dehydrogenase type 2 domain protein n=1 Tax=Beutenbergia cavernae (strain ATCC BAA-8 / DSM 12333 / CCUG 43141 / JCM 11478 / NBRC 16432 / NCIMB 13614 / HKI 0122) TaxID=471853 RepID=C5C4S1_BEUC1|nr:acyl-CoA dehydrogenase family protein [Beutenbergia cavernae]ACQ80049.1 Acyl-CoA dehydrogenase type 2 domain protein [Beutenbergia cavernae DSM 12333]